jgi:hypothetical protein
MKLSATAQAVTQALLIHTMQKPEELQSKRDLFEDITHAHYLERWKDQPYEPMSKEASRQGSWPRRCPGRRRSRDR